MAERATAIVTGGAGFIGSHLCKALKQQGFRVINVDTKVGVDILDIDRIRQLFLGAKFVFHTAALPRVQYSIEHPQETHKANVEGTLSVLLAAKDAGIERVIYSGSSSVYGDQDSLP